MKQNAYLYMSKEQLELHENNYREARQYAKSKIEEGKILNEEIILEVHKTLMKGVGIGGFYRQDYTDVDNATHPFPHPYQVAARMKEYYDRLSVRSFVNGLPETESPIELAAWTHNEFLAIRPFEGANGRTARIMLNYQLESNGYLPVNIPFEDYDAYSKMLDNYCKEGDLRPFAKYIEGLELQEINRQLRLLENEQSLNPLKRIGNMIGNNRISMHPTPRFKGLEI